MGIATTVRKNNSQGDLICTESGRSVFSSISYNNSVIQQAFEGTKICNCKDNMMKSNLVIGGKTLNCKDKMMPYNVYVQNSYTDPTIVTGALSYYDRRNFTVRNSDGSGSSYTFGFPCVRVPGDVKSGYFQDWGTHWVIVINDNEVFLRYAAKIATMQKSGGYTYIPYEELPEQSRLSTGNQITRKIRSISTDTKAFPLGGTFYSLHYLDIPGNVKCGSYWGNGGEAFFTGDNSMNAPATGFVTGEKTTTVIKENGHTYIPITNSTSSLYYSQFVV